MIATFQEPNLRIQSANNESDTISYRFETLSADQINLFVKRAGKETRVLGRYRVLGNEQLWIAFKEGDHPDTGTPPDEAMPIVPAHNVRYMWLQRVATGSEKIRERVKPNNDPE